MSRLRSIAGLVMLLLLMDQLYRLLHPQVNLVRACLVGGTAYATLLLAEWAGLRRAGAIGPWIAPALRGGTAVFASAFGSVLLIEAGWLVSRSAPSVAVHVALLALAYLAWEPARRLRAARTP